MKKGDVLNGYRIETEPTNAGGGMSQWAFGTKDGAEFFVKLFLAPKYPADDGPGSPAAKARKRAVCHAFEHRHVEIARRLDPSKPGAGNLVVPCDFFRVDATYVKVMPKVDATSLPDAHRLTGHQIRVLLRSLAFSLRMLHGEQVVHGDIKPDNVMVERGGEDLYISKLIDFDEAYVVGDPPLPEHIVGDPIYYSPELLRYIKRDERLPADALGTASDMFSLGLFLHHFLTGRLPAFDRTSVNYPAEALLARIPLDLSALPPAIQSIVAKMLAIVPERRPDIQAFIDFLASVEAEALVPAITAPAAPAPIRPATADAVPSAPTHHRDRPSGAHGRGSSGLEPSTRPPERPSHRPMRPDPFPKPDRASKSTETGGLRSTIGRRSRPTDEPES